MDLDAASSKRDLSDRSPDTSLADTVKRLKETIHSPVRPVHVEKETEPTMNDILSAIRDQTSKMATRNDLLDMRASINQDITLCISQAVDPLKDDVADLRSRVEQLEVAGPQLQGAMAGASIASLEGRLAELTMSMEKGFLAVVGNLCTASGEGSAKSWLNEQISNVQAPAPSEIFSKGDFRGFLYAKFDNIPTRDRFVDMMRKQSLAHSSCQVWVDVARTIDNQAKRGFCSV